MKNSIFHAKKRVYDSSGDLTDCHDSKDPADIQNYLQNGDIPETIQYFRRSHRTR
ncbi:Hypothetical protein FKW44_021319, partial [Caligus rogercresseyi]